MTTQTTLQARSTTTARAAAVAAALLLAGTCLAAPASAAPPQPGEPSAAVPAPAGQRPANTGHLTTLTTRVAPPTRAGHSTYRLVEEPQLGALWTYAEPSGSTARPGVTSKDGWDLLGGGTFDAASGHWTQGAFNADDMTRAAVAFTRHWQATGDAASREQAYELLRGATYLQVDSGPDAGNVVLWMQPDGQLNRSAEPVELPDPSDSAESYWLARTVWALGEGYAAFAASDDARDREFAGFLAQRMALSLDALQRQSLGRYGQWQVSDGDRVPGWLIAGGADATSGAVLGLAAFVGADGRVVGEGADPAVTEEARTALRKYAEGVAAMGTPPTSDVTTRGRGTAVPTYPFGAVLPWTQSRSQWHAWGSQMPAALAEAYDVLGDPALLSPAVDDVRVFTPLLLTSGGPENSWAPAPVDRSQIAYGADARLASVLAIADETGDRKLGTQVAGAAGAWFFGANPAGVPVYDLRTGVTNDGVNADRSVNKNSGAESTIHGLLAALALDEHPAAAAIATQQTRVTARNGLQVVEGEAGTASGAAAAGSVVTLPEGKAWTGEAQWSGGAYRSLPVGAATRLALPAPGGPGQRWVSVVVDLGAQPGTPAPRLSVTALDSTTGTTTALGDVDLRGVEQGVSAGPGSLRALPLGVPVPDGADALVVTSSGSAAAGPASLDAVLVVPQTPSLTLSTPDGGRTTTVTGALTR